MTRLRTGNKRLLRNLGLHRPRYRSGENAFARRLRREVSKSSARMREYADQLRRHADVIGMVTSLYEPPSYADNRSARHPWAKDGSDVLLVAPSHYLGYPEPLIPNVGVAPYVSGFIDKKGSDR